MRNGQSRKESCTHSVGGIHGGLVLGSITDQTLGLGEGNPRGSGAVTLVVGNDLNTLILPDTHAGVGSTEIDTNSRAVNLLSRHLLMHKKKLVGSRINTKVKDISEKNDSHAPIRCPL
jgi:hypothetical protein